MTNEQKFWNKIIVKDNGCWEPRNKSASNGYCQVRTKWRRGQLVHRVAVELATGKPIPEGMEVDHLCKNRRCCNPDHLEVVTHWENIRRSDRAKLTEAQVKVIRAEYTQGGVTKSDMARKYGVCATHMGHILRGECWTVLSGD